MEKKLLPLTLELQQRDQQIIDLKEELEMRHEKGDIITIDKTSVYREKNIPIFAL